MFAAKTPLYLRDVTFKTKDVDGENKKVVVLTFMCQPFKPEMAAELDIKSRLFNASTGEPDPVMKSAECAISLPTQRVTFHAAPDSPNKRLEIEHARVSPTIKVRKDKEGPVYAATFSIDFDYPTPDGLLFLAHGINDQHFVTFETEQGDMLEGAEDLEERNAGPELRPGVKAMAAFEDDGGATH